MYDHPNITKAWQEGPGAFPMFTRAQVAWVFRKKGPIYRLRVRAGPVGLYCQYWDCESTNNDDGTLSVVARFLKLVSDPDLGNMLLEYHTVHKYGIIKDT